MKKFTLFIIMSLAFSGCTRPNYGLPNYQNWTKCFGEKTKTCLDNNTPYLADNFVTEYRDNINEPQLLIWHTFKRSGDVFSMHGQVKSYRIDEINIKFYTRDLGRWHLVQITIFSRFGSTPKNQNIPIFEKESAFGQKFIDFKKKSGIKDEEIEIPTVMFKE